MSRSTQYIGLTQDAINFVEENRTKQESKLIEICTGMFGELVYGHEYILNPPKGPNKAIRAVETYQDSPWSSGPMIFTYLKLFLIKESEEEIEYAEAFKWVLNPAVKSEVDIQRGHYWV